MLPALPGTQPGQVFLRSFATNSALALCVVGTTAAIVALANTATPESRRRALLKQLAVDEGFPDSLLVEFLDLSAPVAPRRGDAARAGLRYGDRFALRKPLAATL
jgi:hypothetical protein